MTSIARATRWIIPILLLLALFSAFASAVGTDQDDGSQQDDQDDSQPPRPRTPPGPEPEHARRQRREHLLEPDDGLHQQQSWMLSDYAPFALYPDVARFYVRRWTSATTSWISPNCPASSLPSPPSRMGPSACACPGPSGQPQSVYGQMEIEHLWTWCADWRDLAGRDSPFPRVFIPDIWNGQGPCPRFEQTGVLHRMPDRIMQHNGWFRIDPTPRAAMEAQEDLDNALIPMLRRSLGSSGLPELDRAVFQGAATLQLLTEAWASWVQSLLERRGHLVMELVWNLAHSWLSVGRPDLWERISAARYFGAAPLGAWFNHPLESAGTIRRLIRLGVPVYYRWEEGEHGNHIELADLRPRAPPRDESQGVVMPPLSPHREGRAARFWHRYTQRSPVRSAFATTEDGRPLHVSREEMAYLTENDPAARAPPLRFQDLPRNDAPGPSRRTSRPPRRTRPPSDIDSSSQASVRSKKGSLASRMSSPPPNARVTPPPAVHGPDTADADWEFVFGETHDNAVQLYDSEAHGGRLPTHGDRVRFALSHLMTFNTGRERTLITDDDDSMDTDGALEALMLGETEAHHVRPALAIAESLPVDERYERWASGVREVLSRPHGRAALMRGGLVARIAREFGVTHESVLAGPSASAQDVPNERVIHAEGGRSLVDDYLSESELAVILGHVGIRGDSLWPDEAIFRANGWDGIWTEWHEAWFVDALTVMRSPGLCATSRREQWRNAMRTLRHRASRGKAND